MIELPNGKVARTLQEQVGYNAKKITEIINALNGLDVKDYDYFELESASGTLSEEQQAIVEGDKCFIVYNGILFVKRGSDSTYEDFYAVGVSITSQTGYNVLSQYRIRITLADMSYAYSQIDLNIYDKNEADSAIAAVPVVVANPTLAGTEDALTGIQVGDTKYAISAGGKYYLHIIKLYFSTNAPSYPCINLITSSSTPFTASTLASTLWAAGINSYNKCIKTCNMCIITAGSSVVVYEGLFAFNSSTIEMYGKNIFDGNLKEATLTSVDSDLVYEL